jgi:hypothetical protein
MKTKTPEMLIKVWKMKEDVYQDIKAMSADEIFNYVRKKSKNFMLVKKSKLKKRTSK